jgi:anti-sigma factor RsiW
MMRCDHSRIYLPAYLDDELDVAESLRVHRHLVECPNCQLAQSEQLVLRSALRDSALYAHPSTAFSNRIEAAVRRASKEKSRSHRPWWFEWFGLGASQWVPAAAALLVVMTIGAMLVTRLHSADEQLIARAVLTGHVRSLQVSHLVDVPSSDRHTVKPWFQGKLDFSPPVPDLSELNWILIGGRLDYVGGRPVAALVYQRRLHDINVFLWPNHGSVDDTIKQEDAQGYQLLHWNGAETTYWVVSDLNSAELLDLARALRGH